jgi:hypothetical protein
LTNAVQILAGVLLPSATVFLLLLCNDKAMLGPWVNGRWLNLFTGAVIWVLIMLSIILTAATVFPDMTGKTILTVLAGGTALGIAGFVVITVMRRNRSEPLAVIEPVPTKEARTIRATWRMSELDALPPLNLSLSKRIWMVVLRAYLIGAVILVVIKVVQLALGQ